MIVHEKKGDHVGTHNCTTIRGIYKKVDTVFEYEGPGKILSPTILSLRYFSTELYQQQLHLS